MTKPDDFPYNDEFFFDDKQRARASDQFSRVWFAVYSERIGSTFKEYDEATKRLKLRFQLFGYVVVACAVVALSVAALEPTVLRQFASEFWIKVLAGLAALFGVISVLAGYWGMGISDRKMHWLRNRMLCERIRQWRWQYYCAHTREILVAIGNPEQEREYGEKRDREFSDFVTDLRTNDRNRLKEILLENVQKPVFVWLRPEFEFNLQDEERLNDLQTAMQNGLAEQLVAAYGDIRIGAQKRYAEYLIGKDKGRFSTHPAKQKEWLHVSGVLLLLMIFALHIAVLLGVLSPLSEHAASWVSVSAVILALCALGLRAVDDGLRPSEHLGRYTGYLAETSSIGQAFEQAKTAEIKRNLMIALETAAYKEMADFLQAGNRSRYVM